MLHTLLRGDNIQLNNNTVKQFQDSVNLISESQIEMVVKIAPYYYGIGKKKRYGQFRLNELEHRILKKRNGYYFLVLMSGKYFLGGKIIPAKKLKFQSRLSWFKIIDLPKNFITLEKWGLTDG